MADYEIGYKKPPKDSQFRQGRSGNPKGRPKIPNNLASEVYAACNEKVRVKDGKVSREITKLQAYLIQLTNKAASGDVKAGKELLRLHQAVGVGQFETAIKTPRIIVEFVKAKNGRGAHPIPAEPTVVGDEEEEEEGEDS